MTDPTAHEWPAHFLDLKRELVPPTAEERVTASWNDLLGELAKHTAEIVREGPSFLPQVNFADLNKLTFDEIDVIRRKSCVVVRGVVDTKTASGWKAELEEIIKANPHITGYPVDQKQYFDLFWTRPQVEARGHTNVMKVSAWLNNLAHFKSGKVPEGVDLSVPMSYADRFRIRPPGTDWEWLPPHIDGGGVERWSDKKFRRCFEDILAGNWRQHDPYELEPRFGARDAVIHQQAQQSVFRTFQGWLSMTETGPAEGTLQVFPGVQLSNAYIILRPFFRPTVPEDSPDILDPKNWKFDISTPDFPGMVWSGDAYFPRPTPKAFPHLRLDETLTSVPKVNPGDMVFWQCDVIHAVEQNHTGTNDSAVMFICPAPKTPFNVDYITKQLKAFTEGGVPPDYAARFGKELPLSFGRATQADIKDPMGRVAMGLPIEVA